MESKRDLAINQVPITTKHLSLNYGINLKLLAVSKDKEEAAYKPELVDLRFNDWHAWRVTTVNDDFELIELSKRAREFLLLEVHEGQKNLVASVAQSFADALFPPADYEYGPPLPWIRGVLRNSEPAAFIMCADPTEQQKDPWLWRLLVDQSHQRCGIGKFAVKSVLARYREMGCARVLVCWAPTEGNAGDFYKKIGFVETGEKMGEEIVAEFKL
jgi:diamine N-acetyltransferase